MAHFIQDPSIARAIDDLKRRWPAIGAAADHPLTEWFILRRRRRNSFFAFPPPWTMRVLWIWMILMFAYRFRASGFAFMVLALCFFTPVRLPQAITGMFRKKQHVRDVREPADLLRDNDPSHLDQINLTALDFTDLLAACAACCHDAWRRHAFACACVLFAACPLFVIGIPSTSANLYPFVALFLGLFISVGWVMCRRSAIVAAAMRDLFSNLRDRKTKIHVKGPILTDHLWLALVPAPLVASLVFVSLGIWGWIVSTVIGWIVIASIIAIRMDRAVEACFLQFAAEGRRRFQAMLNPDSSDPLKELELYGRMTLLEHQRKSNHGGKGTETI